MEAIGTPDVEELVRISNETNGRTICDRATVAAGVRDRLLGLLGRRSLEPGEGLLLRTTAVVHTVGMSMSIDVIGLDRSGQVIGIRAHLKPGRIAFFGWKTRSILELPAGQSTRMQVSLGDRFAFLG